MAAQRAAGGGLKHEGIGHMRGHVRHWVPSDFLRQEFRAFVDRINGELILSTSFLFRRLARGFRPDPLQPGLAGGAGFIKPGQRRGVGPK